MPNSPSRLNVYFASDAPIAAVLRRGPAGWARLSVWHTDTDEFEHGQSIAGRVYERRCDLSPDGRLFAYFVRKSPRGADVSADSWIAISKPPYFTALALWEVGGTWCSGAYFVDDQRVWASGTTDAPSLGALPRWLRQATWDDLPYVDRTADWPDRNVHINRLLRGGWTTVEPMTPDATWERERPGGGASLIAAPSRTADFQTYGGRHIDAYALRTTDGAQSQLGEATWADWDHRGRLVIARDGALRVVDPSTLKHRKIADFNVQTPGAQGSPATAKRWPGPPK